MIKFYEISLYWNSFTSGSGDAVLTDDGLKPANYNSKKFKTIDDAIAEAEEIKQDVIDKDWYMGDRQVVVLETQEIEDGEFLIAEVWTSCEF